MRARPRTTPRRKKGIRLALIAGALGATLFATSPSKAQVCHQVGFHPQWAPNFDYESPEICHWGSQDDINGVVRVVKNILRNP